MEGMREEDWILLYDIVFHTTHIARPDDKKKDYYVTPCGIRWSPDKPGVLERVERERDVFGLEMPTCDTCAREDARLYGEKRLKKIDDMMKDTRDRKP